MGGVAWRCRVSKRMVEPERHRRASEAQRRLIRGGCMMTNGDKQVARWSVRKECLCAKGAAEGPCSWLEDASGGATADATAAPVAVDGRARRGRSRETRRGVFMGACKMRGPCLCDARVAPATPRRDALLPRCARPRLPRSHVPDVPTIVPRPRPSSPASRLRLPSRPCFCCAPRRRATPQWPPHRRLRRPPPPDLAISSLRGTRLHLPLSPTVCPPTTATTGTSLRRRLPLGRKSERCVQRVFYSVPIPSSRSFHRSYPRSAPSPQPMRLLLFYFDLYNHFTRISMRWNICRACDADPASLAVTPLFPPAPSTSARLCV